MNEYIVYDKITDFAGKEHNFIIAAIKVNIKDKIKAKAELISPYNDIQDIFGYASIGIKTGLAICNPNDKFDDKCGVSKAIARANNSNIVLSMEYADQLTDSMVNLYLLQEAQYVKKYPERFIKGYKKAKEKYLKEKEIKDLENNFTEAEKDIVKNIKKNPSYLDNIKKYLSFWNK